MALPAGVTQLGTFKGDKGDTGSLAFATAEKVGWNAQPKVTMVGPESARGAHFEIPMPLPGPETVNNDDATELLIKNPTKTRGALGGAIESDVTKLIGYVNAKAAGMGGNVDNGARLVAAIAATPDGGVLSVPRDDYLCTTMAVIPVDKRITIDFNGSRLLNAVDNGPLMRFVGAFEAIRSVSSVERTILEPTQGGWISAPTPAVRLTVNGATVNWQRGDYVKLFSDNPLEGQRDLGTPDEDPNRLSRYGQTLQVHRVSGSTVWLQGYLREIEGYTQNVRIARMPRDKTVTIMNLDVDVRDSEFSVDNWNYTGVEFRDVFRPRAHNVQILRTHGPGFQFSGCFQYEALNCHVAVARNRLDPYVGPSQVPTYGYGIIDINSEQGRVTGYLAGLVRHAFTDDSARFAAGLAEPGRYGRTFGTIVSDSRCTGASSAAWDTHGNSDSVTFADVHAVGCESAFSLRGIRHRVANCSSINCETGIRIQDESTKGAWSWGHSIDGLLIDGARVPVFAAVRVGGPFSNIREDREISLANINSRNGRGIAAYLRNITTKLENLSFHFATTEGDSNDQTFYVQNCYVAGEADFDFRDSATKAKRVVVAVDSTIVLDSYDVAFKAANQPDLLASVNSPNVSMLGGTLSGRVPSEVVAGASVSWQVATVGAGITGRKGERPGTVTLTPAEATNSGNTKLTQAFADAEARTIMLTVGPVTSATTLAMLPSGKMDGQRAVIMLAAGSTAALTVRHDIPGRTALRGSIDLPINLGQEMELFWNGDKWVQTYAM